MYSQPDPLDEARRAGFDLSLLESNLALTPEERIRQHDGALALVLELEQIRRDRDAKLEPPAAASS